MHRSLRSLSLSLLFASTLLTGCSLSTTAGPSTMDGSALQGIVHGGQQPVIGGKLYVLEANTTGYGNTSKSLLTTGDGSDSIGTYVLTGSYGQFNITAGQYTCDSGAQAYMLVLGGNSGGGANPNVGLMSILGNCPAAGNFLLTVPYLYINEVTTVAAAYSMAGFATDATHVSSSGTALAKTGIANAFATFGNLANVATGVVASQTKGSNGTIPTNKINTLANILAACVNSKGLSSGSVSANCSTLFGAAKSSGSSGTTPTNTATAAIYMAHNPGTANIATLYGLQAAVATPFNPALSSQPTDLTLTLKFTGGGITNQLSYGAPRSVAVDGSGNIWVVSCFTSNATALSEFGPLGVPASSTGYDLGLNEAAAVAVDRDSSHVWVANYAGDNVYRFTVAGSSHSSYTTGSNSGPFDLAIDGSGYLWVAPSSLTSIQKMDPTNGSILDTFTPTAPAHATDHPFVVGISAGATPNIWEGADQNEAAVIFNYAHTTQTRVPLVSIGDTSGLVSAVNSMAFDASGNAWFSQSGSNGVSRMNGAGTLSARTAFSGTFAAPIPPATVYPNPQGINVDGDGNVWITGTDGTYDGSAYPVSGTSTTATNTIAKVDPSLNVLSGTLGFVPPTNTTIPNGIAVDGSGNVWYNSVTNGGLYEIVGSAAPVVTPISYGAQQSKLGARP